MVLTIDTVDPKTEENRLGNCNFRKRRQLLKYGVVASVIIILFIVIIVLAARKPTETASASTDSDCTSAECYSYASQLVESIDSSVDPCDNFYDFACGRWMKNTFVEDSETWNSAFVAAKVKTNKNLRELLESPITDNNSAFGKAQRAYGACANLNSTGIIDSANTFTKRLSEKTGGWPIAVGPHWANSTNVQSFDDLLEIIAELRRVKLRILLFSLTSLPDRYNSSNIIFTISQPDTTSLPEDNEGRKSLVDEIVRKAKIVNSSSESFDEKFANQSAWKVIDLLDKVNGMIKLTFKESSVATYEKLDISTLRKKTGIDWLKFLKNLGKGPFELHENDLVAVYNLDYFIELSKCVSGNCFEWSSVVDYQVYAAQFEPTDVVVSGLYSSVVGEFPNPRVAPRWLECVRLISSWFHYALAHEYVKVYYDYEKDNVEVGNLVDGVFDTFNARILKLDWLTDEDKKNSKLKSDHMKRQYFYSNWVGNAEKVQEYYADLGIGDDAVSNLFAARLFDSDKKLTAIFRNNEEFTEWPTDPLTSNAHYMPQRNSIFINAGILQPPVFGPDRLKAMNYGGLGSIIGHEITHGYDQKGTDYNHLGNVDSWLSGAGKNKFAQNAQCFSQQYGRFQLTPVDLPTLTSNVTINSINTLSENIADNGGLQQAFGAYKRWVEEHGPEKVPDVLKHYSAEQIFFISFSQQWCVKYSYSKSLENTVLKGVHSPPKFRVLGSLSNFEEFAKAFHCKSRDVMNPKLKCSLW